MDIEIDTTYDQVLEWIKNHEKGKSVDPGNLKLIYNSFMDKVEAKVKENEREQQRKVGDYFCRLSWVVPSPNDKLLYLL